MRHPPPQNLPPGSIPSSTRRLRIALGTWVAIEARLHAASSASIPPRSAPCEADNSPLVAGASIDTGTREHPARAAGELAAIEAAYAAIGDIDIRMHPRRDGSEIARINSTPPGTPVQIQPDTWRLLQLARRLYDLTEGVFDPCLPTRPGRLGDIEIQPNSPVLICHAPVEIDLGGIAKGHAIDRAVEKLQELGCASGLVNAGGDLRVFGERAETIFLRRHALDSRARDGSGLLPGRSELVPLTLQHAALAFSDLDASNRPAEHQGYYLRDGASPRDAISRAVTPPGPQTPRSAAVIASTAAVADALTKCLLLCPNEVASRVLQEFGASVAQ